MKGKFCERKVRWNWVKRKRNWLERAEYSKNSFDKDKSLFSTVIPLANAFPVPQCGYTFVSLLYAKMSSHMTSEPANTKFEIFDP